MFDYKQKKSHFPGFRHDRYKECHVALYLTNKRQIHSEGFRACFEIVSHEGLLVWLPSSKECTTIIERRQEKNISLDVFVEETITKTQNGMDETQLPFELKVSLIHLLLAENSKWDG